MFKFNYVLERKFDSGRKLLDYITVGSANRKIDFGFRGHSNSSWELETSLSRYVSNMGILNTSSNQRKKHSLSLASKKLLAEFKKSLIINNGLAKERSEDIDVWQYGQHYGLPSPLLDWSYSPFVALFFALLEPNKTSQTSSRAVWQIDLDILEHLNRGLVNDFRPTVNISPKSKLEQAYPELEVIYPNFHNNPRIAFQQGLFIKNEYFPTIERWLYMITQVLPMNASERPTIEKYVFDCNEKQRLELLDILDKMNVNYRTLFPDIHGAVQAAIDQTVRSFLNPEVKMIGFLKENFDN